MIYKILRPAEWADLQANGTTTGAPIDVTDGYIHFSTATQVQETAAKHFAGEEGLMLLAVDDGTLGADLKWEPSRGGQDFPHLYRNLNMADVLWHKQIDYQSGAHIFPEDLV